METSPGTFILLDYLICFYFKMKYAFLESILQTNLTTPAAVVIAIALVSISTGKLVNTTTLIVNRRIVGAEAITIGMTPILVQEVAHVEDIESQLDGVNLTSYLEAVLLTEVNIEMMLEWQVICITLVVLATVLAEVRILCNPLLNISRCISSVSLSPWLSPNMRLVKVLLLYLVSSKRILSICASVGMKNRSLPLEPSSFTSP